MLKITVVCQFVKLHNVQLWNYNSAKCDNQYSLLMLDICGFTSLDPPEVVLIIQSQWQREKPAAKFYHISLNQCVFPTIVTQIPAVTNLKLITKPNVLIALLEYIDYFQSEWQHETNIWEGLPFPLLFCITVFHFKHSYCN